MKQLCAQLENPNHWCRMTAQRLLLERQDKKAWPYLRKLAQKGGTPETRVHALRTLEGAGGLPGSEKVLTAALSDASPAVREHAILLNERRCAVNPDLASLIALAKEDPNPRVRFQAALSLGEARGDNALLALRDIALRDLDSKWTRAAVLTSIAGRENQFLQGMLLEGTPKPSESFPAMMGELARIVALASPRPTLAQVLREFLVWNRPVDLAWQMAAIGGFGDGLRSRGVATAEHSALMNLVNEDSNNLRERVNSLFMRASELVPETGQPVSTRLAAVSLLSQADYLVAGRALEKAVDPRQPAEIQTAAVRALGQMAGGEGAAALTTRERWNAYSPAVRDMVLSVLTANTNSLHTLFTAIEAGDVPAWTVNADRRNQLMKHKDEATKTRAEKLFKDLTPGDRMKAYEENKSVLALKGDGKNGHAVFEKSCITCHTFAGEGKLVGPDLTGIRNQPADVILLHIIVPEYEINPIYTCYNVETKSAEAYTGVLVGETPTTITLRMAQGIEQQIPRSQIASMMTSRLSLMPQELEKTMTKQELADLLAFLRGQ